MAGNTARKFSAGPQEFIVNVPKLPDGQKFSVMKFNLSLGVDITSWDDVSMVREDNRTVWEQSDTEPEFGAGSEYGKALRQEQRRKKLGYSASSYNHEAQPWNLRIGGKNGRQFKGIREGGAGEHADYWIFKKTGEGRFDALPIDQWYNFMPVARYKTLNIDEAEEQFEKRNKVMNQFALKAALDRDSEAGAKPEASGKLMKISDRDDFPSDESDDEDREEKRAIKEEEEEAKSKGKVSKKGSKTGLKTANAKGKRRRKKEGEGEENQDGESEDGEEEGREVDYMSDSGSESDPLEVPEEEKVDEKGVNDESGLRKLLSDNEEEDEDEPDTMESQNILEEGKETREQDKESDSEGSESDDPDKADIKSALFLQDKDVKGGEKRGLEETDTADAGPSAKKIKTEPESHPSGITQEDVRRYLIRKPMSTKDLLAKLKPKAKNLSKDQLVKRLADIMKQLNPKKEQTERKGKKVLLFSLSQ